MAEAFLDIWRDDGGILGLIVRLHALLTRVNKRLHIREGLELRRRN